MEMVPVTSSQLAAVGYDRETRTLRIRFADYRHKGNDRLIPGALYEYDDVPEDIHAGLMAAHSAGAYFGEHVRKGGFTFRRIEEEENA